MPLNTVADYITAARTLLQDEQPSSRRYSDAEMAEALGFALLDIRRMRPEFFNSIAGAVSSTPDIGRATSTATAVVVDEMYRPAIVFAVVGHVMLRDEEESSQQMAAGYMNRFISKLLSIAA